MSVIFVVSRDGGREREARKASTDTSGVHRRGSSDAFV